MPSERPSGGVTYIECQNCGLVYPGFFAEDPSPPIPRQWYQGCDFEGDTEHKIVEIEEIRYVE